MRRAVEAAYRAVTGAEPAFLFSGWGGKLDECERAVVEKRLPDPLKDVPQAFEAIKTAMQMDAGYAWSWHCNIAMASIDEGAPHDSGNAAAARFMQLCFGVDTSNPPTAATPDAGELVSG
jgi:hypothetical protein